MGRGHILQRLYWCFLRTYRYHRLFWVSGSYFLGIFSVYIHYYFAIIPLVMLSSGLLISYTHIQTPKRRNRSLIVIGACLLALLIGNLYAGFRDTLLSTLTQASVTGKITQIHTHKAILKTSSGEQYKIYFSKHHDPKKLPKAGDQIRCQLTPLDKKHQSPFFSKHDRYQGISDRAFVNSFESVQNGHNNLETLSCAINARLNVFCRNTLPAPYADVLLSIIFGDKYRELPETWIQLFQDLGLTHLLVVSGSQVALLSTSCLMIIRFISKHPFWVYPCISVVHIGFFILTGGGASVMRAIISAQLIIILELSRHSSSIGHRFILIILIMGLIDPRILMDLGAYLSILATFSLLFVAPKLQESILPKAPALIRRSISHSLAPFLILSPLIIAVFHRFSWISLIANILVVGIGEWVVTVGFFSSGLSFIWPQLAGYLQGSCFAMIRFIELICHTVRLVPHPVINLSESSVIFLYGVECCILVALFHNNKRIKYLCMGCMLVYLGFLSIKPHNDLLISIFDVGQGDAILIQTQRQNILIDTGPQKTYADFLNKKPAIQLRQELVAKGVNKIDLLILTHLDLDHIGGIETVLSLVPVAGIATHGIDSEKHRIIDSIAQAYQIPLITLKQGDRLVFDKSSYIDILAPLRSRIPGIIAENNRSLVLKLQHQNLSFLLTGDLESEEETAISHYYQRYLNTDVFKLGHHGSNSSSTATLLYHNTPNIVINSCALKNRYHHPHPSVIKRIQLIGASYLGTEVSGSIYLKSDGQRLYAQL